MQRHQLAFLGIAPFVIFFGLSIYSWELLGHSGKQLFLYYSIIIANFVAGTIWLTQQRVLGVSLAIWSNVFSLATFLGFLLPATWSLGVLIVIYLAILLVELAADLKQKQLSSQYIRARINVTTIVVLLHLVMLLINF